MHYCIQFESDEDKRKLFLGVYMTIKELLSEMEIATISLRNQSRIQIENEIANNNQLIVQLKERILALQKRQELLKSQLKTYQQ